MHPVRFYEGGGTYPLRGFPPLLSKSACCVRCGGSWKRSYGTTYTGTNGETPDTDKVGPSELPRQLSTLLPNEGGSNRNGGAQADHVPLLHVPE